MGLLIKGMDMPKLDENADRLWVPGWLEISKDGKAIFCTGTHFDPNTIRSYAIEEVHAPHGRLIDADKLTKVIEENDYILSNYHNPYINERAMSTIDIKQAIDEAQTIIEEEV